MNVIILSEILSSRMANEHPENQDSNCPTLFKSGKYITAILIHNENY